ncbi:LysM peptidoglycan-binding domain-containing protein [Roseateles amylovorans]|jgi:Contractile injection system tube protein/LysM domain|uniref:LysM peptidoglycan-binding domain-containing protein n=1 Tax=Roseateles amylovorans TaxID=2978473 RepID=A0ABY6NLZ9_9BURK|nr:LysM peptidoglycan-binding domain-containing protein [Roseateles amylovorans]UZH44151.1 LysM peptidoglycan-binding domain-containing protein [Roseateles amylovorans]
MTALTRAKLIELDAGFKKEKPGGVRVEVQFNPETLKLTFANEIKQPEGGDQQAGNNGRQFVGAGTTKLALQLWFDVTAMEKNAVDDVRRLTTKVIHFMTPQNADEDPNKKVPPGVRFQWGTFLFDGMVESLEESLEFFSPDGKPLRASISLTLSQQKILEAQFKGAGRVPVRPGHAPPGHAPLKAALQGDSLQAIAGRLSKGDWQGIAAANGIEDPLRMAPGQLVNLQASVGGGSTGGASFGASLGASFGGGASVGNSSGGGGLNASLGGASATLSIG